MRKNDNLIVTSFIVSAITLGVCFCLFFVSTLRKNNIESDLKNNKEELALKKQAANKLKDEFDAFDADEIKELEKEYENWQRQNEKLIDVLS